MHAHPTPAHRPATANDRFKRRSGIVTSNGIMLAVAIHFALFALFPRVTAADMGGFTPRDLEVIDLPEKIDWPAPPERIARPANPIFTSDVDIDVAPGVTDFDAWDPVDLAPPAPAAGRDVADAPVFVPHTVNPRLLNQPEVQRALVQRYPPLLRGAGIGGETLVWLLVAEDGRVRQTRVHTSSDRPQLDEAALAVASMMRFAPALNRTQPVAVWVALPIRFEARDQRP